MEIKRKFFYLVNKTKYCWEYKGYVQKNGYGKFYANNKTYYAHRFSYEIVNGPIPKGMEIDHLCRNRKCVNPDHLESVSHLINVRRGKAVKQKCKNNHAFTKENTYLMKEGWKKCRTCEINRKNKEYRAKHNYKEIISNKNKVKCIKGHIFSKENTMIINNQRICRECNKARCKNYRLKNKN